MPPAFRYVHRSGISLLASDATAYFPPSGNDASAVTTEAYVQSLMRQAYTAKNLFAYVSDYAGTISIVYRSRDSGVNGNLTFTPTTTGVWEDTSNTDTLASGDLYCIQGAFTGIGHNESFAQTVNAVTLENATSVGIDLASYSSNVSFDSINNRYASISGHFVTNTIEVHVQRTARTSATLAKLFVYMISGTPTTPVFRTRVNATNGGQSVGPTGAGTWEDTSGTDTIAVGDEINYHGVTTGGTAMALRLAQVQTTSDAIQHVAGSVSPSSTGLQHCPLDGAALGQEALAQVTMRNTNVLKNLYAYLSAYSLNATPTFSVRINGATSAIQVSPTGTGVWEDTSNTVTLVATDEANYLFDSSAATTGSTTINVFSVEETQPVVASFGIPFIMQSPSAIHMLTR